MLTCGRGQRIGIFAGSGVGKSVLLGMMSRYTAADVNVIGLIGERGREVNEFIERDLGSEGLARSVVVVATSDEPALVRVQGRLHRDRRRRILSRPGQARAAAHGLASRGFAMAQREIGLAAGEPPTTRGYPPSVFAACCRGCVERAGRARRAASPAFYSVLVEGDDENEPVADTVRGLLDGHIWLSRKLAARGHYPAVDVLESISRLMNDVASEQHRAAAQTIRELLAAYPRSRRPDLDRRLSPRRNRAVDTAVEMRDAIEELFRQRVDHKLALGSVGRPAESPRRSAKQNSKALHRRTLPNSPALLPNRDNGHEKSQRVTKKMRSPSHRAGPSP